MNSGFYSIGASWSLKLGNGPPNTRVRLLGTSNGQFWEIPEWRRTDGIGILEVEGKFAEGAEGSHTLKVEIGGATSNPISFVVSNCKH